MNVTRKQTLVQLTEALVAELDAIAKRKAQSRSELIRDVLGTFVKRESDAEKDRRTIAAYVRYPGPIIDEYGNMDDFHEAALKDMQFDDDWSEVYAKWIQEHGDSR